MVTLVDIQIDGIEFLLIGLDATLLEALLTSLEEEFPGLLLCSAG